MMSRLAGWAGLAVALSVVLVGDLRAAEKLPQQPARSRAPAFSPRKKTAALPNLRTQAPTAVVRSGPDLYIVLNLEFKNKADCDQFKMDGVIPLIKFSRF